MKSKLIMGFLAVVAVLVEPLVELFRIAMRAVNAGAPPLARLIRFAQHPFQKRGYGKLMAGGHGIRFAIGLAVVAMLMLLPGLVADATAGVMLASGALATPRPLKDLLSELKTIQEKYKGKPMPQAEGEKFEALAAEAKHMQDEHDRDVQIKKLELLGGQIDDAPMPGGERKDGNDLSASSLLFGGEAVVGYLPLGAATIAHPGVQDFLRAGSPKGVIGEGRFENAIEGMVNGKRCVLIPVTAKQAAEIRQRVESKSIMQKAVPTIGAAVIRADRITDITRTTMQDRLRLRDVINVSQTDSNAVEYVTITSYTRAATEVAESGSKPEATMAVSTATVPVRTIAVHMPVTEQQLQDIPQIQNMIDTELLYDLDKEEEEQVMYGSGAGQEFQGILTLGGVPAITRTVTATQNLDRIRIGITDVMLAGYEPNAVAIHPIDWEAVVLLKGTDNRYVWTIVTNDIGEARVWGVRPIETVAMKNPANLQRYLLVGDYLRGATLWDRQQRNVLIGWINAQFTQNLRTVRAEKRAAFGVKRPLAFAKYETATAV